MINSRSFVKHAMIYGLSGLLLQAGGFVLLPLYTRCLTLADYGVLEILDRLAQTAGTVLLFGGFNQAVMTFYKQSRTEMERRRVVASAFSLIGLTTLFGGGLLLVLAGRLNDMLGVFGHHDTSGISDGLLRLAIVVILLEPLSQIPMILFQARVESLRILAIRLGQFLLRVALCVWFVKYLHSGVAGALGATAVMGVIFGFGLCTRELLRGVAWPDFGQLADMLRFALPLMPGGLCFLLMHHGDRFFLLRFRGMEDVGIYSLGYKLAMVAGMFSLTPLYMVWSARMYEVAREPDAARIFGTVFTRVSACYLFVALGLGLFQEEAVALLGGAAYARASTVVAPVLLAYFCQSASSLMDAGLYIRRRMGLKLGVTLTTTAVMFVLYAVMIPRYGSQGAAWATSLGFAFLVLCTWAVTQRVFPVRYEWGRLAALLALAIVLWLSSRLLPAEPWTWPIKAGLWLLAPIAAWTTGMMSRREKEQVHALTDEARQRLLTCLMWSRSLRTRNNQPEASARAEDSPSLTLLYQPEASARAEEKPSLTLRAGKEAAHLR